MHKKILLDALAEKYANCTYCPLGKLGRKNVVFGKGNPDTRVLLIGEGPGQQEDELNAPFVGRSGKLLTHALSLCGVEREDIYITNIVKCRPPANRAPTPEEQAKCTSLLLFAQIKIIDPIRIVTLGSTAMSLFAPGKKITSLRGTSVSYGKYEVLPTFHPAYILRNMSQFQTFTQDLKNAFNF